MRKLLPAILPLLILSCKDKNVKPTDNTISADSSKASHKDSSVVISKTEDSVKFVYKEWAHLELAGYSVSAKNRIEYAGKDEPPDEDFDKSMAASYLFVFNKKTKTTDTLKLSTDGGGSSEITVQDVTDSLQVKPLLLEVTWPGNSDWYTSFFIGYKDNVLKVLFEQEDFAKAVTLKRKDQNTLYGFVAERDDLVHAFEDYPVFVSLPDYKVTFVTPDIQYIGYETKAVEKFKARRMINNQETGEFYIVKRGAKIMVDTLYRVTHMVRLIINDSITVKTKTEAVKDKIQGDSAG